MGLEIIGITGKHNSALYYSAGGVVEEALLNQIKALCDNPMLQDCKIRIMPDAHPGKVGPIGLSMTLHEDTPIMPALIGNDIGCGVLCMKVKTKHKLTASDFQQLDKVIRGTVIKIDPFVYANLPDFVNSSKARKNFGTIGGGNHFIEIDQGEEKDIYFIIVHTGSRSVGNDVYEYFMKKGNALLNNVPYENTYLTGELKDQYLDCLNDVYEYAKENRYVIASHIASEMKWVDLDYIDIMHNYIDIYSDIMGMSEEIRTLHKGSIHAGYGRDVIIPINMRDGAILGIGEDNEKWNSSAPHGAGRILSRSEVPNNYSLTDYKKSMEGIYSPSISKNTLDECPMAYRDLESIKCAIQDTVSIRHILKPVYNFKNGK